MRSRRGKIDLSCSPQSLCRKLLLETNRELAGWELDSQAEVSECLIN